MVNKPRAKGTSAETAVVAYLNGHGWPYAERRSLNGALDKGDIAGCPGLCIEVKYAGAGMKIGSWMAETEVETANSKADFGFLVVKPKGLGSTRTGQWLAFMLSGNFRRLTNLERRHQLYIVDGAPDRFTEAIMRQSLTAGLRSVMTDQLLALTLRPPGSKEDPDSWYRIMTLEHMVMLLRAAGYGSPLDEAPQTQQLVDIPVPLLRRVP